MNVVPLKINNNINKLTGSILQTLVYFDIFQYPLLKEEIREFLSYPVTNNEFETAMEKLLLAGVIFKIGSFYSVQNDPRLEGRRIQGNSRAEKLLVRAKKIGAFLYQFPFVRGVAISGSLSKNCAEEKADIDFFIITKKNRLWIARSCMHLFKKFTFLIGRQHLYCMNYYIDEEMLLIDEKNIYTATEIVTLLPVAGSSSLEIFFETNSWAGNWFPNHNLETVKAGSRNSWVKRSAEWLFNKAGSRLDDYLFKWSTSRWQKKEKRGSKNIKGRIMNLLTGKHFAKSNPESFQEKLIVIYNGKVAALKDQWPQYFG